VYYALQQMLEIIPQCGHPDTLTLRAERHSARMSKITNDGLTWSGRLAQDAL